MRVDVITTFPEMFAAQSPGVLGVSIPSRAIAAGKLRVHAHDLRGFTLNKHGKTDDRPFGGGPGMVMSCQPVWDAVQTTMLLDPTPPTIIMPSPQGTRLDQPLVERLAGRPRLLFLCGHYEGIDERVIERLQPVEVSLGDYVLSSGELAALTMIDAVTRLLPGVLGDAQSAVQDSFSDRSGTTEPETSGPVEPKPATPGNVLDNRLLDCPHYTRPAVWDGVPVPEVLLSGDHAAIDAWRLEQRRLRTRLRRPDLL